MKKIEHLFQSIMYQKSLKNFNVLTDGKSFFDVPVKNKEAYEKIMSITKSNHYTTGNLLD